MAWSPWLLSSDLWEGQSFFCSREWALEALSTTEALFISVSHAYKEFPGNMATLQGSQSAECLLQLKASSLGLSKKYTGSQGLKPSVFQNIYTLVLPLPHCVSLGKPIHLPKMWFLLLQDRVCISYHFVPLQPPYTPPTLPPNLST